MLSQLSILAALFLLDSLVISNPVLHAVTRDDAIVNEISFDLEPESEIDESDASLLLSNDETLNFQRQTLLNKIVDRMITAVVKNLTEQNMAKIQIPDLNYEFHTGSSWWTVTGDLKAYGGTFEDLTTLKRTADADMKKNGTNLTVSVGIGVTRAQAAYKNYELRYGIFNMNGQVTGSIDGVSVSTSAILKYEHKPCETVLESLRVGQLEQISIQMTGLGPLNGMLSYLATWIVEKWQHDIVATLETKLKEIGNENLHHFNCEMLRPGWNL